MSRVSRNILANLLGGAWITILTVVITPFQVNVLGIEGFGVIAFISTLQVAFTAFDLGLSSTLTRELAADQSPGKVDSAELLRTASTIYWLSAAVVGIALAMSAGAIARNWFKASELGPSVLEQSLRVVALYLALRWPVALYCGVLAGLQRMDILNGVKVASATLRLAGGLVVLWHWRTLDAFLEWTSFSALVEVAAYWLACRRVHRNISIRPGISWPALKRVWRFSLSMNVLAVLAVLIVQLDRLFISKMLTLDALGYYNVAYNAAAGIALIVASVSSAMLPSFASAHSEGAVNLLLSRYDDSNRVMLFLTGLAAFMFIFYGEYILSLWVGPGVAARAWVPLALLAVGFWCGAAIASLYSLAIGAGIPDRHLNVNLLIVVPYALTLYGLIRHFGVNGAAAAWVVLNLSYALLLVPALHRRIFGNSASLWLYNIILPFLLLGVAAFGLPRAIFQMHVLPYGSSAYLLALASSIAAYVVLGYFLLGKRVRYNLRLPMIFRGT